MKLNTVRRAGDGAFHQALINIEEDGNMKLKCNLCMKKHGNAVKTDQLLLVTIDGVDYLACIKCVNAVKGGQSHDDNTESRGHASGIPL